MTVGERIKQLREQNEMTRSDLAYFMGAKTAYIEVSRWERGSIIPRLPTVARVCEVFRISLAEFFEGVQI